MKRRLLSFLARGDVAVRPAATAGRVLLDAGEWGTIAADAALLAAMAKDGVLVRHGTRLSLAPKRATTGLGGADASRFQDQHRELEIVQVETSGEPALALINLAESPLGQLMRRRGADGRPFLTQAEFAAGERLRSDYTRGRIMPRLGANWEASVASGTRAQGGGLAELTDAALAARQRVDAAIAAVGPELSGVLIDVCCFLKGLELVERERGWPVRSAKIVLKTALGVLSRHYNPAAGRSVRHRSLHWGSEDYRPKMSM
ncbi:hypothetical protein G6N73_20835 [Mesorhizobium camelthorni]|uniref:DUF6456 domain-containing protein n=2 Tax=Allomesorhizobium camelthorni TaxID=475069 RepID=A0A6G4WGT9_9HYPH|nr:hypothetical protein [Mesorhizobium camelthorni]